MGLFLHLETQFFIRCFELRCIIYYVIKQLQSFVEVDMRFNGPNKPILTSASVNIGLFGPLNLISTSTKDYNCIISYQEQVIIIDIIARTSHNKI